jgi:hypothetical protein
VVRITPGERNLALVFTMSSLASLGQRDQCKMCQSTLYAEHVLLSDVEKSNYLALFRQQTRRHKHNFVQSREVFSTRWR